MNNPEIPAASWVQVHVLHCLADTAVAVVEVVAGLREAWELPLFG